MTTVFSFGVLTGAALMAYSVRAGWVKVETIDKCFDAVENQAKKLFDKEEKGNDISAESESAETK